MRHVQLSAVPFSHRNHFHALGLGAGFPPAMCRGRVPPTLLLKFVVSGQVVSWTSDIVVDDSHEKKLRGKVKNHVQSRVWHHLTRTRTYISHVTQY